MKKSAVLITLLIFIASVFIINFYGLKIKIYNPTFYVSNVTCINEDAQLKDDGSYSIVVPYTKNLVYPIYYKVFPENADNRTIKFLYDTSSTVATVDAFGKVIFNKAGVIIVYLKTIDGSEIIKKIKIIAY